MRLSVDAFSWPTDRAGEALEALARAARLSVTPTIPNAAAVEDTACTLGLEVERLSVRYSDIDGLVQNVAPALLLVHSSDPPCVIALLETAPKRARIIARDHAIRTIPLAELQDALYLGAERTHGAQVDALLEHIPLSRSRHALARGALLREQVAPLPLDAGWTVRLSPSAPFLRQLQKAGVLHTLRAMALAHVVSLVLSLFAWWVIGHGVLSGHLDSGWLYAWALLLATLIPIRALASWWQGAANIATGLLLKRRMILGALQLDPEEIRHQGMGQLLGRVIEVNALEELAMHGGFVSLAALVELVITVPILALGPAGIASVLLFGGWIAVAAMLARRLEVHWVECSDRDDQQYRRGVAGPSHADCAGAPR